jgi:hypothetical protein
MMVAHPLKWILPRFGISAVIPMLGIVCYPADILRKLES